MPDKQIILSPAPFRAPRVIAVPEGMSIRQIVHRAGCQDQAVLVEIDGVPVPRDRWDEAPPVASHGLISLPLHGGGG